MSRIDKLKEQHPELNVSVIDLLAKVDPTDSYKYTEFLVKRIKEWFGGDSTEKTQLSIGIELIGQENVEILNEFEIHSKAGRIKKNDIGQHKDFNSLSTSVKEAEEILKQKEAEKQAIKLMDTDEYCVVIPLSYEASKVYGSGTKWCTTQEKYFHDYVRNYKLIYIIEKKTNEKYAVSRKKNDDTKIQAWLSDDSETSPLLLPLPVEVISTIVQEVNKNECIGDLIKTKEVFSFKPSSNDLLDSISRYILNSNVGDGDYMNLLRQYGFYAGGGGGGSIYTSYGDYTFGVDPAINNTNESVADPDYDDYNHDDEEDEESPF